MKARLLLVHPVPSCLQWEQALLAALLLLALRQ
jgi:hypothetical protein